MVLAVQTYYGFKMFGGESLVGATVALSMTRELGPAITALMVTGRTGSSMAAEIGTMRVTEQIDALYTMSVNPVQYLIMPRVLAGIVTATHLPKKAPRFRHRRPPCACPRQTHRGRFRATNRVLLLFTAGSLAPPKASV